VLDISERKRLEQRLSFLADHDGLTGLRNRRLFERDLTAQVQRCERYGEQALLLMLDLDDFKAINDSYGHATGDEMLKAVADGLTARVRASDLVARLGGDEFAILMPHIRPDRVAALATDIRDAVGRIEVKIGDGALRPGVSVGAAVIDDSARGNEAVLATADRAMYRDKQERRGWRTGGPA